MSSDREESPVEERRKRSESPQRKERDNKEKRHRHKRSRSPQKDRSDRRGGDRNDRRRSRSRSRSPRRDRNRRHDRRGDKPIIPQRPKLFQRASDTSTSTVDNNNWSTRIAAVASDDGQRSKFEKLLGMHKNPGSSDTSNKSNKPNLKAIDEKDVSSMKKELAKMENDLDNQYQYGRAFTHSFKGRGL